MENNKDGEESAAAYVSSSEDDPDWKPGCSSESEEENDENVEDENATSDPLAEDPLAVSRGEISVQEESRTTGTSDLSDFSEEEWFEVDVRRLSDGRSASAPNYLNYYTVDELLESHSDERFQGFGGEDDEDVGMDRFAEVIVFLESGDFFDSDGGGSGGAFSSASLQQDDSLSLSDDGELPEDPHEREVIGSLPEPTISLQAAAVTGNTKELRRWQLWKGGNRGRACHKHRGDLPLHCAARAGDVATVEQLLKEGSNVTVTNHREHTALEIASRNGHAAVVKTLLENGAGLDPEEMDRAFCATKSWAVVQILAEHDHPDLRSNNSNDENDQSPWLYQMLFRVVQKGRVTMLRGLLRMGANANSTGILGWTPLQIAARRGHTRCVSELLRHGADVGGRDDFKWTALHYAAREGHYEIVKMLLKAGADVTAMCRTGRTPIEVTQDEATRQLLESHQLWHVI